jgi:hypothetical protein
MRDKHEDTSTPPPGFTPPPRAPVRGSNRARFAKACLCILGIALAVAAVGVLAVPALA